MKTLDRPLVVAAGAGSGKTFTLTKRIVGALEDGFVSDIGEVCAITFTKKAAAELKSRIKGELRACGLAGQALKVDDAWISTIHGMCSRILRSHAIELGISPSFGVIEAAEMRDYLARAVDAVLSDIQAEGSSGRVDELFEAYKPRSFGNEASVEKMLTELVEAASIQAGGTSSFELPGICLSPRAALERLVEIMEQLLADAEGRAEGSARNAWMGKTQQQVDKAREALAAGLDDYAEAYALAAPFKLAKNFGGAERKARIAGVEGEFGACLMELRLGASRGCLATLVSLAGRVLEEYACLKRADGVLDNNDLLVQAARAIEEHPAIAARYTDKFKLIMVDEFQDTDQMQVDMIKRLAGEGACRLCTVGDAQQSIYRFRGADVSVYRRHLDFVRETAGEGSIIELSDNFRSHADVLSFVDRVFEKPAMFGGEFMSLGAGRDEGRVASPFKAGGPRIMVQHTTILPGGGGTDEARALAARRIARAFADLEAQGHSASQMVLLLGGMRYAGVYAQALRDEGLSCVISGGSVFAGSPEASIIRALVRVVANPAETKALLGVLTSPMFALTAGDLLEAGGLSGFWRTAQEAAERGTEGFSPQLACALLVLGAARRGAGTVPVARIVERAVVESGWLSRLQGGGAEGLASAGNVMKAIRMIDSIQRSGALGASSVMRRFEDRLDNSKEAPGSLSVSGGNSVRIMTIHSSKGLEFPIVATAEMKEVKPSSSGLVVATVAGKAYVSLNRSGVGGVGSDSANVDAARDYVLGDLSDEGELARAIGEDAGAVHRHLALCQYEFLGEAEEAKRLLYVALTRAKEAVIVSTFGRRTSGPSNPMGLPKSAFLGVMEGLDPSLEAFAQGTSMLDFGGTRPALVECVTCGEGDADGADGAAASPSCGDAAGGAVDAGGERPAFRIPAAPEPREMSPVKFKALHRGIFSYSSISDASHEGDLLAVLAQSHAVQVDEAAQDAFEPGSGADDGSPGFGVPVRLGGADGSADGVAETDSLPEALPAEDEWGVDASRAFDEDRATDLGTAFHRLAQYAVVTREGGEALAYPPEERVRALSLTCNLEAGQRRRLEAALGRWFGSDEARAMEALPHLAAEVPFFVAVDEASGERAYLEGEIDLLGYDEERVHAHVVDYKTGGRAGETPDELRCKHVLQAACYAYAIMLQGARTVDASFVRVERPRADDPSQPQCVRYHFEAADLPRLSEAIAKAYGLSLAR